MTKTAAIIGGGVIGGGWAARFLLNGWDVQIFDPDPEAQRKIGEVLNNARRSMPGLSDVALPTAGQLRFCDTLSDAVVGVDWIQESVPERLEVKQKVYQKVQEYCPEDAIIGSSTSGFKPSELQAGASRPEQVLVTHPFNPVYLMPLVEIVPTANNSPTLVARAKDTLKSIGMFPLHVRKEIDAHIADRFLEAVWREALWLVKDGVATTEEIDQAIRMGFGIRWAQMGLFDTYRVAGGEAGMKHFMEQFGPALQWPWTKLMDVPEFTDELASLIADQSDAQSGHLSIRDMERLRDDNLVSIMRALKSRNFASGMVLNAHDAKLSDSAGMVRHMDDITDLSMPIITVRRAVPVDWLDYNEHMTESRYLQAFADATDRLMEIVGCDMNYIATGGSFFTAETHIRHIDETHLGSVIEINTRVLMAQGKKMHLWHEMYAGESLLATGEHMLVHVSLKTRRPAPFSPQIDANLRLICEAQSDLKIPNGMGRYVGQPR